MIVDTRGTGFHFTDPNKLCVRFDLANNGKPVCYSWPEHGSGNGWLVLDQGPRVEINSGAQLFGNFSPHADDDYALPGDGLRAVWTVQIGDSGVTDLDKKHADELLGYPRSPQTFLRTGPNRTATIAPLPLSPTSSASSPLRQHGSCVPTSRLQNGFPHLGHVDVCSAQRVAMQSPEHELMGLFRHATETKYPSYPCSSDICLFQSRINR